MVVSRILKRRNEFIWHTRQCTLVAQDLAVDWIENHYHIREELRKMCSRRKVRRKECLTNITPMDENTDLVLMRTFLMSVREQANRSPTSSLDTLFTNSSPISTGKSINSLEPNSLFLCIQNLWSTNGCHPDTIDSTYWSIAMEPSIWAKTLIDIRPPGEISFSK